jgi:signal transduction histidine kinase
VSRRLIAWAALAGAAIAATAVVLPIVVPAEPLSGVRIARHVAIGLAWIAAGLVAAWRRPSNRIGPLMAAVGFLWFLPDVNWWHSPLPYTVVLFLADLYLAVAAHVVLAFPSGRLSSNLERAVVGLAYLNALVLANVGDLFRDPRAHGCSGCSHNLALAYSDRSITDAADLSSTVLQGVVAAAVVTLLVLRWRRSTPPGRRVLAPVLWTGILVAALQIALTLQAGSDEGTALGNVSGLAFNAFPLAFLAGLLGTRLHRGAVAQLVIDLGAAPAPAEVREALARALGDPSLEVAYWLPAEDRFVDAGGTAVQLPAGSATRSVSLLEHADRPVAALIYDSSLLEDAMFLQAVGAATGLALENARLQAELRAQLAEVRASRMRILAAGDEERRRLERDLHDGAQQRLLATRLALQLVRERTAEHDSDAGSLLDEADAEVQGALEDIRTLARGLHPAILSENGLAAALSALARRSSMPVEITHAPVDRLPAQIETAAYFVVAEALTNAAKHAAASRVRIDIQEQNGHVLVLVHDDGVGGASAIPSGGLSGLRDRIEALGGRVAIASPPGGGTSLRAEIPCA